MASNLVDGFLPDTAWRMIYRTLEGLVRARARNHAQVAQRVLDLGTLEKSQAAVDPVRDAAGDQHFLKLTRLRVGTIQHGNFFAAAPLHHPVLDAVDDKSRLVFFVVSRVIHDRLARIAVGPEFLAEALAVVVDQRVGL